MADNVSDDLSLVEITRRELEQGGPMVVSFLAELSLFAYSDDPEEIELKKEAYEAIISTGLKSEHEGVQAVSAQTSLDLYLNGHVTSAQYAYDVCQNMALLNKIDQTFIPQAVLVNYRQPVMQHVRAPSKLPSHYDAFVNMVSYYYAETVKDQPNFLGHIDKVGSAAAATLYKQGMNPKELAAALSQVHESIAAINNKDNKKILQVAKDNSKVVDILSNEFTLEINQIVASKIENYTQQNIVKEDPLTASQILVKLGKSESFFNLMLISQLGHDNNPHSRMAKDYIVNSGFVTEAEYKNLNAYERAQTLAKVILQ